MATKAKLVQSEWRFPPTTTILNPFCAKLLQNCVVQQFEYTIATILWL